MSQEYWHIFFYNPLCKNRFSSKLSSYCEIATQFDLFLDFSDYFVLQPELNLDINLWGR